MNFFPAEPAGSGAGQVLEDFVEVVLVAETAFRGGHDIRITPAKWAKLAPGSLEKIFEETVSLIKEFPAPAV